jgi:diphthamide synthase subunit DPH2
MDLDTEAERATELLKNKVVDKVTRHRAKEVCVEFTDGTRLYVDHNADDIELSITDGGGRES